jgi:hypothetical protein
MRGPSSVSREVEFEPEEGEPEGARGELHSIDNLIGEFGLCDMPDDPTFFSKVFSPWK